MTEMEMKNWITDRVEALERQMEKRYGIRFEIDGKKCFRFNDREYFMITGLPDFGGIVVEHAFSEKEARKNMFEDGDLFYMDEMSETEMLAAMIREIEE